MVFDTFRKNIKSDNDFLMKMHENTMNNLCVFVKFPEALCRIITFELKCMKMYENQ